MSILKQLFGKSKPKNRVKICVECGMPEGEHKDWCTIYKGYKAAAARRATAAAAGD